MVEELAELQVHAYALTLHSRFISGDFLLTSRGVITGLQEEGVLFLPFEQRMTRDMKKMRERRSARRSAASHSSKSTGAGLIDEARRTDSSYSRVDLLGNGPADAPWAGDVEMAVLSAHDDADLAAKLAAVASTPPKAGKLKRSNSIVF
ncbi:hypothetical protein COCOBI_07-2090 [Coccomyxa sp. Obi]|nr:hypothetical protein COCOBI_07-2090 [Coccomyxa sp. Obi]